MQWIMRVLAAPIGPTHPIGLSLGCLLLVGLAGLGGCLDVRGFEGDWQGPIVDEAAVRQGFAADTTVESLVLTDVDLNRMSATLTLSDGKFTQTPLVRITRASADLLGSLTFDTEPIRTYLHVAAPANDRLGCTALALISLFGDDHVELRLIRGNDLYGVFHLDRGP